MPCDHDYEDVGGELICFSCNRPQNAIDLAQRWVNRYDNPERQFSWSDYTMASEARDIIEWLLEDLEK